MRPLVISLAFICLAAAAVLAAPSPASATAAQGESGATPIDVLDFYTGVVDNRRCCDCHLDVC
ncbi:MAG: hypothetical protein JWP43_2192 [Ramlibacter sp.]|jgi:hypothetical protein|nr:hypothetical protein [Ramlibacter sp.]